MNRYINSVLIVITLCTLSCKSNLEKQDNVVSENLVNEKINITNKDTVEWFTYNDSARMYTLPKFSFIISKDENNSYYYQQFPKDQYTKKVIVENDNIKSGTYFISEKESEKFTIQYNTKKQPVEIRRFTTKNDDPPKLKSVEKYKYENNLISSFEFIDSIRITPKHYEVSILMNHKYDSLNRLNQTSISKKLGNRSFSVVDSIKYFYHENDTIPFSVKKSAYKGTEYKIIQKNKTRLEIEKIQKATFKDSISVIKTTYSYEFDNKERILEYKKAMDINIPPDLKEQRSEKYIFEYSDDNNINQIPMLLYELGDLNVIPNSDIYWYFTSNVEIDQYPDVHLRTDLGTFELPKKIERFKSYNNDKWFPVSKYETK